MSFKELLRRKKCFELQMCKLLNMLFTNVFISKPRDLRGHKVVPVISHKFDFILLPSSQWVFRVLAIKDAKFSKLASSWKSHKNKIKNKK